MLVQTKNEAAGIRQCLASLEDFDEVIVVDSLSTDGTADLARMMGASVVDFKWNGEYPKKKQWQLDNVSTRNRWVLFLDADESPSPQLISWLATAFASERLNVAAFDIRLDYVFSGRTLRHGHRVVKRALVDRNRVRFPEVDDLGAPGMGELEGHYQPNVRGKVGAAGGRILHNDLDPVRTWFDRHNRYSDWESYLRTRIMSRKAVAQSRSIQGRIFERVPFKPMAFFLWSYVVRAGFRDGRAGLDYAIALSMYYWQIELKVRERKRTGG